MSKQQFIQLADRDRAMAAVLMAECAVKALRGVDYCAEYQEAQRLQARANFNMNKLNVRIELGRGTSRVAME